MANCKLCGKIIDDPHPLLGRIAPEMWNAEAIMADYGSVGCFFAARTRDPELSDKYRSGV